MRGKEGRPSEPTGETGCVVAGHLLAELDAAVLDREREATAAMRRMEAIAALHERMLTGSRQEGMATMLNQFEHLAAETDVPGRFAALDSALACYETALDCFMIANRRRSGKAIREGLCALLLTDDASNADRRAVADLARALHDYFWVAPSDEADRRIRASWDRAYSGRG